MEGYFKLTSVLFYFCFFFKKKVLSEKQQKVGYFPSWKNGKFSGKSLPKTYLSPVRIDHIEKLIH